MLNYWSGLIFKEKKPGDRIADGENPSRNMRHARVPGNCLTRRGTFSPDSKMDRPGRKTLSNKRFPTEIKSATNPAARRIRICFMGAGEFAVPVLRALCCDSRFELAAVITQPDREAGRKRVLTPSPLGKWADAAGLECERTASVNTEDFLVRMGKLDLDLIVVVSFGQLLKQPLLDLPKAGCLNIHASLLPKYRGASPIASAILAGDAETGVAFMRMERGLDSGPVYAVSRMEIGPEMTTDILQERLAALAGERIGEVAERVAKGLARAVPQPADGVTVAAKIRKSDGSIDWREDAQVIERKIRAYAKWPSARFCIEAKGRPVPVKIAAARATSWSSSAGEPGRILAFPENNRLMMVQCGSGALIVERVLPEGKKEMAVADFRNGARLPVGAVLLNGPDKPNDTADR